jgi:hypothetical protein
MGDVDSKRDRIAAGRVLTSLFLMEIAPDGTTFHTIMSVRRKFTWS